MNFLSNILQNHNTAFPTQRKKLTEEYREFVDAANKGDGEKIAQELVDLAFCAIGMVGLLGYDFDELYEQTYQEALKKYPRKVYESYRESGFSHEESMYKLKAGWEKTYGKT